MEIFKQLHQLKQMLSKIKNMFSNSQKNPQANDQLPFKHPKIDQANQKQCPFMSNKSKQSSKQSSCPANEKEAKKEINSDSEQQEKPRGGCPFMGGSDRKRNPPLSLAEQGYDEPFVSKFKYYLSANKLDFSAMKTGKSSPLIRQTFEKYPIYLKHTLFYNGEDYKKVRSMECCSRFMAYQQLREKGNKFFNKGKYYQALDYYERAYSLFRWLQYHQELNQSRVSSAVQSERSLDQLSETGSKIQIPLAQKQEQPGDVFGDLKEKYKQFFITYSDSNVRECNGEELSETADTDMRKSLLVQLYLNMAAAYINLHHYSLAEQVINDGLELSDRVSQLYFRKAQSIGLCKNSSLQRLYLAKSLAEKAVQMRPTQKIFSTANANILKMLNLHDSQEAYLCCLKQINEGIQKAQAINKDVYNRVYLRAKQIHLIEQRMIQEGKTPRQNLNQKSLNSCTQMRILQRMLAKYIRVIEFYTQAKNPLQVQLAKKQFQQCLRVCHEVERLFSIKLQETDNEIGGLNSEKIQKRVNIIKTRFAQDIYNAGKYNFTMLEWAIKEIVKEDAQKQKVMEQQRKANSPQVVSQQKKGYSNLIYLLFLIPLALMVFNYFII